MDFRHRKMRRSIDRRIQQGLGTEYLEKKDPVIDLAITQLEEYLDGNRTQFNLPLLTVGTDFQKRVWKELIRVRYGETCSYLELAERTGKKESVRAVAGANGANAISIIIPCHRVIGGDGGLVGYAGGLSLKKRLLELEMGTHLQMNLF